MTNITILDHAFSFHTSGESCSAEISTFLRRLSFNGEGKISASQQLAEFNSFCEFIDLSDEFEKCRLFAATFTGRILSWFEFLPAKSIHSWKHFTKLFLDTHENYNYKKLGLELENFRRHKDESLNDFFSRFMSICCRFRERHQLSEKDTMDWFLYLTSLSDLHDLEKNEKSVIDNMHVSSSIGDDLESNSSDSNVENEIVKNEQITKSYDMQFQEQEKKDNDSTFTLTDNPKTLVVHNTVEDESHILDSSTECASDDIISLSSSHDELVPLIPSQNTLVDQSFSNDVSLEAFNETNHIDREAFNFLYSESYYSLYPDVFTDHKLHLYVNDFLKNTPLWSDFDKIQRNTFLEDEGHIDIHLNLFQICHQEDNNFSTIVTHDTHACSSFVSKDDDSVCNIKRDEKFIYDVLNVEFLQCNMIIISETNVINFNLHIKKYNDVFDFKIIPKCHCILLKSSPDDIVLKNTFSTDSFSRILNHTPDKLLVSHDSHKKSLDLQLDFYDPIFTWLEESFSKRFPCHLLCFVHTKLDLISFLCCKIFQFPILIHHLSSLAGFTLREWLHWKFSFT